MILGCNLELIITMLGQMKVLTSDGTASYMRASGLKVERNGISKRTRRVNWLMHLFYSLLSWESS